MQTNRDPRSFLLQLRMIRSERNWDISRPYDGFAFLVAAGNGDLQRGQRMDLLPFFAGGAAVNLMMKETAGTRVLEVIAR
jgi:hypothetical protein